MHYIISSQTLFYEQAQKSGQFTSKYLEIAPLSEKSLHFKLEIVVIWQIEILKKHRQIKI